MTRFFLIVFAFCDAGLVYQKHRIEYSDDDRCFVGHIVGIRDVIGFHGKSPAALRHAFIEAVDDYLATCEKLRRPPQKLYLRNISE